MCDIKPITILLVEDDEEDCNIISNYIKTREDVKLVGIANSTEKALELIKTHVPDAIILDLELNQGKGSGLEILKDLKTVDIDIKPVIVVTTNISSKTVYRFAHDNGADLIFHKLKEDYSAELVINNILLLRESVANNKVNSLNNKNIETLNDYRNKLSDRINRELDLIGISCHLIGRMYIHDSILYILENDNKKENVFLYLAKKYKKGHSTVGRSIQTAINHAWRKSSIEDLQKYYTAAVSYSTGVPTPTELIYYYVDKVKKSI